MLVTEARGSFACAEPPPHYNKDDNLDSVRCRSSFLKQTEPLWQAFSRLKAKRPTAYLDNPCRSTRRSATTWMQRLEGKPINLRCAGNRPFMRATEKIGR